MGTPRPFRGTVYLPGHDEDGHSIVVTKVSAGSVERLDDLLAGYVERGYAVTRYEVLELPLEDTLR